MRGRALAWALGLGLLSAPAAAQDGNGVLGTVSYRTFTSNAPVLDPWTGSDVTLTVEDPGHRGSCAAAILWNAAIVTGGGPGGGDYTRFTWCAYDIGLIIEDDVGFYFNGSLIEPTAQWQANTEYFVQFWYKPETENQGDSDLDPGGPANNKLMMLMKGFDGGDSRVMIHVRRPTAAGEGTAPTGDGACIAEVDDRPANQYVSIRISRNIDNPRESNDNATLCAGTAIPIGQWSKITAAWKMGTSPTVKIWVGESTTYDAPTSFDDATSEWLFDRTAMNDEMRIFGGYFSDPLEDTGTFGIADVVIASTFPGGAAAAPTVTSVSPSSGTTAGGTAVTITGTGFLDAPTSATFGGTACTGLAFVSATTLTCTTAAHASGAVDVVVTNPDAQAGTGVGVYTYASPTAPGRLGVPARLRD